jgi:hypothetical protein
VRFESSGPASLQQHDAADGEQAEGRRFGNRRAFDDDVESIDLSLSPRFKGHNLDYFIKEAFDECVKNHSYIWITF